MSDNVFKKSSFKKNISKIFSIFKKNVSKDNNDKGKNIIKVGITFWFYKSLFDNWMTEDKYSKNFS